MLHASIPATFEDIHKPDEVRLHVSVRIGQRITHPCLGRKMNNAIEFFVRKQRCHRGCISHIKANKAESGTAREACQARLLETDIVVVVEIVQPDDFVATRQQALGDMHADETGGTGNQYFHFFGFGPGRAK